MLHALRRREFLSYNLKGEKKVAVRAYVCVDYTELAQVRIECEALWIS
jgi:hypothetical protein